jgi:hypothetical protein
LLCSKDNLAECREQLRLTVVLSENALKVAKFSKNQFRQETDAEELASLTQAARMMWSNDPERALEQLEDIRQIYDWDALTTFLGGYQSRGDEYQEP